jgi:hypothetical protein
MDSPLYVLTISPQLLQENLGENRAVLSVAGEISEYANSEISSFVFVLICNL